jgi:HKD family nuclease
MPNSFLLKLFKRSPHDLLGSGLFDETTFYAAIIQDLKSCKHDVIIESPFITSRRMNMLLPVLNSLVARGIKVTIITRNSNEHREQFSIQAKNALQNCK